MKQISDCNLGLGVVLVVGAALVDLDVGYWVVSGVSFRYVSQM